MNEFEIPENKIICAMCKNYIFNTDIKPICKAFPNGIPEDILIGSFNHKTKYLNQKNNFIFEKNKKYSIIRKK